MKTITIEVPDNLSGAVAESDDDLPRAVLLAAAIQRYSRADFPGQRRRASRTTIAEFVAQESLYAPDINDGVRVNRENDDGRACFGKSCL